MSEPEELYIVYGLVDPRTQELRYVGQTRNPRKRRNKHEAARTCALCGEWEMELKALGIKPVFVVLQSGLAREEINEAEKRWILSLRADGARLLNMLVGAPCEPREYPFPEETRAKIAEAMRARWADPVFRAEKVAKMTAAVRTPEVRAKISAGTKGRKLDEETKAKVSEGVRALWEDPEYRTSQEVAVRAGLEKTRANAEVEARRKATMGKPEVRAKIAERSRQMWQNPESREKLLADRRNRGRRKNRPMWNNRVLEVEGCRRRGGCAGP